MSETNTGCRDCIHVRQKDGPLLSESQRSYKYQIGSLRCSDPQISASSVLYWWSGECPVSSLCAIRNAKADCPGFARRENAA